MEITQVHLQLVETLNTTSPQQHSDATTLLDTLSQINIIANNDQVKFSQMYRSLNVDVIFDVIENYFCSSHDDNNQRQQRIKTQVIDACCQLLKKIFSFLKSVDIIEKYGASLQNTSTSTCDQLNVVCLEQILRLADEGDFSFFMSTPLLIQTSIKFLCEEHSETSTLAGRVLKQLISICGNGWLFCEDFIALCKDLLASRNSVMKFRLYDLFVEYVVQYPEYIEECKRCDIFQGLVETIVKGNDILSQLNALEMLSQLASSGPQGLTFVQEVGIVTWCSHVIMTSRDDPLMSFVVPGCIKFFGVLCAADPATIVPQYPHVLRNIFEQLGSSDDPTLTCLCAETISFICSNGEALKRLHGNTPEAIKEAIKTMMKTISNPGEDDYARERMLTSLTKLFQHDDVMMTSDIELNRTCEKLYRYIDGDPMGRLFGLVKIPFAEIRHGCFTLLGHITKNSWAEQDLVLCPGFLEYLLDRKTETEKDGHELKYAIIKNLVLSTTSLENLGGEYFDKLKRYYDQGPFYSESHVSVTYEGDE